MNTRYDFTEAAKEFKYFTPKELADELRNAALKLAVLDDQGTTIVSEVQVAVSSVCEILDKIKEKETAV